LEPSFVELNRAFSEAIRIHVFVKEFCAGLQAVFSGFFKLRRKFGATFGGIT
jgi:hypothetical protein